jgi:Chlorophyll A-B binding protein
MTISPKSSPTTVNLNQWRWGFTPQGESWNGRFAMLGFVAALLTEYLSGQGVLHFYNLMQTVTTAATTAAATVVK